MPSPAGQPPGNNTKAHTVPTAFAGRSGSIDPLCGGKCCYCRYFSMGRPLRIDGATRIAPLERRATWLSAPPAAARPAPQR